MNAHLFISRHDAHDNKLQLNKKLKLKIQVALLSQRACAMLPVCLVSFNSMAYNTSSTVFYYYIAASDLGLPPRTIKFCSIVFGVTFRLLIINTSSSVFRKQQKYWETIRKASLAEAQTASGEQTRITSVDEIDERYCVNHSVVVKL